MLGNFETPSKLKQKRKISMGYVYWMVGNYMKITFFQKNKKERDLNHLDSQFNHVK